MKTRLGIALLLTAVIGLIPASTNGQTNFTWGINQPLTVYDSARVPFSCTPTAKVWAWELGKSGVTRLRGRFEVRGPYDPGWLPTWWKSQWLPSGSFPDDTLSYYSYFPLTFDSITVGNGKQVAVWTKLIGEKPSFWARDAKIHKTLGTFTCDGGFSPGLG